MKVCNLFSMITYMSDILCVTNRILCSEDFFARIERIAKSQPKGIILREKDLSENEYRHLAIDVLEICEKYNVNCILHSFVKATKELDCKSIHLPLHILRTLSEEEKAFFTTLGASCHSVDEAVEAEKLGCPYIIAGHIFDTDCKKDIPSRGIDFLKNVCKSVSVPVYAIGGISAENIEEVLSAGARGACIMSGLMKCDDADRYLSEIREKKNEIQ